MYIYPRKVCVKWRFRQFVVNLVFHVKLDILLSIETTCTLEQEPFVVTRIHNSRHLTN